MKEKDKEEKEEARKKKHVGSDRLIRTNNLELIIWHLPHSCLEAGKALLLKDSASMIIEMWHKIFIISKL